MPDVDMWGGYKLQYLAITCLKVKEYRRMSTKGRDVILLIAGGCKNVNVGYKTFCQRI